MRINRTYSKWSVLVIIASFLAIISISYEFFNDNIFLLNVLLVSLICVEVFTALSENRMLKGLAYSITLITCGYAFYFLVMILFIVFFGAAGGKPQNMPLQYWLIMICNIILFFCAAINLLKLFSDWNE